MELKDLSKYRAAPLVHDANYMLIPVTVFDITDEGMERFNEIYRFHLENFKDDKLPRTYSGGICTSRAVFRPPCWDIQASRSCIEITSLMINGMRRFQFRQDNSNNPEIMGGRKAIRLFSRHFKRITGKSLCEHKIDNGLDIRKTVPKYLVKVNEDYIRESAFIEDARILRNMHHADFHQSFPAGLANTHPEFRSTIEYFYNNRKKRPEYKGCLNSLIGIMWSPSYMNACYAQLARDAITDNNERVLVLTKALEDAGRIPLLWNTDGVWYMGDIYHGPGEGPGLGEWENDHTDCVLRIKSRGAYEYIENGEYHSVIRGVRISDREGWKWGDIFKKNVRSVWFEFEPDKGVVKREAIQI